MSHDRVTGARSPGLAAILEAPGGPSYRQLDHWVRRGFLHPEVRETGDGERNPWAWSSREQQVAIDMGRLVNAGLRPNIAEQVARHPTGGPVVLAPGIVISLFNTPATPVVADDAEGVA